MRDGIYKNPALSMPWRALLKSCMLDAERGEIAREKCERAAGLELREIRPQFMAAFREKAETAGSLLPGFKAFDADVTTSDLGGQNLPLENRMLAHARRLESAGLKGAELVAASCADALQETMSAHERLIEQTILASGSDSDSKATIDAARRAVDSAKIMPIVDSFLAGRSLNLPPARRPIDLDEDLSRLNP
jgi:hypothetical protein